MPRGFLAFPRIPLTPFPSRPWAFVSLSLRLLGQAELQNAAAQLRNAQQQIEAAKSSVRRDAQLAAHAAAQAEAASSALANSLPVVMSALGGLGPELAAVQEGFALGQRHTALAMEELGHELQQMKELIETRLFELREEAEAAVEALTEVNVANAAAHHGAMTEQYQALQAAEERAEDLEAELKNAQVQVRAPPPSLVPGGKALEASFRPWP